MPGDYKKLYNTNVKGLETAIEAGVKKVVYVSSVEGMGFGEEGEIITEEVGFRPDCVVIEYGKTKALASIKALEMAKKVNLPLVTVAPSGIIGPYDYLKGSFTGKAIRMMGSKKLPVHVGGSFDFIDSRDVAKMCYLAMKNAPAYESYLCSGNYSELAGILDIIAEEVNTKIPPVMPAPLAKTLAVLFESIYRVFKDFYNQKRELCQWQSSLFLKSS